MKKKVFRAVLWTGTMFVLLGIPSVNALADGPGQTPWDPPKANTLADGPGPTPWDPPPKVAATIR